MEGNRSSPEAEDVLDQLQQLPPEERDRVLQMMNEPTEPPLVEWASNPLKAKAALNIDEPVEAILYHKSRDFYLLCIPPRGVTEGTPIFVGDSKV